MRKFKRPIAKRRYSLGALYARWKPVHGLSITKLQYKFAGHTIQVFASGNWTIKRKRTVIADGCEVDCEGAKYISQCRLYYELKQRSNG